MGYFILFLYANVFNAQAAVVQHTSSTSTSSWSYVDWLRAEVKYHKGKAVYWAHMDGHYLYTNNAEDHTISTSYLKWLSAEWEHDWKYYHWRTSIDVVSTPQSRYFPYSCVATQEEGGSNSWAGYYGFISPPYDYAGGSGYSSWYSVPKAIQDHIALLEYIRYGGGAWGPRTREKCGI